jgi:hypothetical protein
MQGTIVTDYITDYLYLNRRIEFIDLHECGENKPLIGSLLIDGNNIFRRVNFTGPVLFHGDHMFLPMARQMDDPVQFSLCAINLKTFEMAVNKQKFDYIHPKEIRKNWFIFSSDQLGLNTEHLDLMWVF